MFGVSLILHLAQSYNKKWLLRWPLTIEGNAFTGVDPRIRLDPRIELEYRIRLNYRIRLDPRNRSDDQIRGLDQNCLYSRWFFTHVFKGWHPCRIHLKSICCPLHTVFNKLYEGIIQKQSVESSKNACTCNNVALWFVMDHNYAIVIWKFYII